MKYRVAVAGREFEVEIENDTVRLADRAVECRLEGAPGAPLRRLVRDGSSRAFVVLPEGRGAWRLLSGGQRVDAVALDPRALAVRSGGAGAPASHAGAVRAPMPGRVVRVLVEPGAAVTQGQALIVVEAMKMENELTSPATGTVARVHVAAGDRVEKGAALVDVT